MTRDDARAKKIKAEARALVAALGIPYVLARRLALESFEDVDDEYLSSLRLSREDLVRAVLQDTCESLVGAAPDKVGEHGLRLNLRLPDGLRDAEIVEASLVENSIIVSLVERFEGGTEVCSARVDATLRVEGRMEREDADEAERAGIVELLDIDFEEQLYDPLSVEDEGFWQGDTEVALARGIEVEFEFAVTLEPDAESVEDVEFVDSLQRVVA